MQKLQTSHLWKPAGLIIIDFLLFSLTDPHEVPSIMLIVAFLFLAATLFYLFRAVVRALNWYGIRPTHPRRLVMSVTGVISAILALQSIGELTTRDILVILPLILISYVYLSYGRAAKQSQL